jgi:hypothetical protein
MIDAGKKYVGIRATATSANPTRFRWMVSKEGEPFDV